MWPSFQYLIALGQLHRNLIAKSEFVPDDFIEISFTLDDWHNSSLLNCRGPLETVSVDA